MSPRVVLILVLSLLLVLAIGAEQPIAERRTIAVSVLDKDGNFVEGLTSADFRGEHRSEPVIIVAATEDTRSRRFAVLVDISGDMRGWKWRQALAAAEDAVNRLVPAHHIGLFTVAGQLGQETGFTQEAKELQEALTRLRQIKPQGHTALNAALVVLSRHWPSPAIGDAIYLISDGEDTVSKPTAADVESELTRSGIRFHIAWLKEVTPFPSDFLIRLRKADLWRRKLSEATGGITVEISRGTLDAERLADLLAPLYAAMTRVYRLEVELPRTVDKPRDWKLEVVDERGKKRKDLTVAYPRLLVPLSDTGTGN